jgi:hypothetical protein
MSGSKSGSGPFDFVTDATLTLNPDYK